MVGLLGSGRVGQVCLAEHPRAFAPRRSQDPGAALHHPLIVEAHDHRQYQRRLRALLARAHGDEVNDRDFVDRYRRTATDLGFEWHMAMARRCHAGGRSIGFRVSKETKRDEM